MSLALAPSAPQPEAAVDGADSTCIDRRSLRTGLSLFAVHSALYFVTLAGALAPLPIPLNAAFAVANGVLIALLFIIGHDGAHGSFVPGQKLNLRIARLAFVPCAHSVSLWRVIHNKLHHGRTNLKGVDGVWAPMSKAEYDRAHPLRRWLERVYRGPFGPLIYYYLEFWIQRVLLPLASEVRADWRRHLPESLFVLAALALTLAGILTAGKALAPDRPLWLVFLIGWAIPYTVWNYLMAFTTYLNHTHPSIPWFDDEASWSRSEANLYGTAYVRMPFNIPLYTKVMAHTAHHLQPGVPVYALPEAQAELNRRYSGLVDYKLNVGEYKKIYRACKLFDFDRRCWTDFRGVPTT
jgi:omega-6 fatty acid desaturase (delta-12 desaturase)